MTIFDQKYTTEKEDTTSPEHHLWVSVLSKAAHDAIYTSDWRESKLAISWFKGKGAGFRAVCEMAGKDPNYVYTRMMKMICERERHMEAIKSGNKIYVKENPLLRRGGKIFHTHYRGLGRKRKPQRIAKKVGRPRKKNEKYVVMGRKGGRPKLYGV